MIICVSVEAGDKQNSFVIIFSIWNTMIGTVVVCLPWAFQSAGIILSICICFSQLMVSFYTTKLIVDATGNDADFSVTLRKYFGTAAYYIGMFSPAIIILGALTVLFVILSQLSYPILLQIYLWCTPDDYEPPVEQEPVFTSFSSAYTSLLLYFVMVAVSSKRNLHGFIRLNSLSAIFFFMFVIVISGLGAYAFTNTEF